MGKVVSFNKEFYRRFATEFVNIYEAQGPIAAAHFSLNSSLPWGNDDRLLQARQYITEEFLSRGYTFPSTEAEVV